MAIIDKKDFGGNEVYIDDLVIHKTRDNSTALNYEDFIMPYHQGIYGTAVNCGDSSYGLHVKFRRLDERMVVPRKRDEDAGYDIYGIPTQEEEERGYYSFKKGEVRMVPTGIATEIPRGYVAIVKERGSTGSKGLAIRCGVIDSGYRGEWFITVNSLVDDVEYDVNKAIAQVIFVKSWDVIWDEDDLSDSERGEGKLGSSGK